MLQNTKICTVVHICGLLEMGSDSFLSTTPQKLNIFLRSFFFNNKENCAIKIYKVQVSFSAFNPTNL